jgi:hypothetical protein
MTALGNEAPILAIYGILFLVVIRRSVLLSRGVPVSTNRLIGQAALYLFLFVLTVALDILVLPTWTFGVDIGVLVVGAIVASVHVRRVTQFWIRPDGQWMYRLGILLPALYLSLYAVRVVVELVVLPDPFGSTGPIAALTLGQQEALAAVDALFALSAGMLVGRSIGVYQAYQERLRQPPSPTPPVPSPPWGN